MRIALIIFLLSLTTLAHARLLRHVDSDTGSIIFSNMPASTAEKKREAVNSKNANSEREPARNPVAHTNTAFPRVSSQAQRLRDLDRRKILKAELEIEKGALQAAMSRKAANDIVHRHEMNIAALEREI